MSNQEGVNRRHKRGSSLKVLAWARVHSSQMQVLQREDKLGVTRSAPLEPNFFWRILLEALVIGAGLCLSIFAAQWRYGLNLADEGWLWYISKRTALGEVPLRDFFSYDPGRYYWSAAVFKILGRGGFYEQLLANYLFAVVGLALAYLAMARAGLSRKWRILILLLLGIVIGFPRHKIYEQTLSLIAVAAIAFLFVAPDRIRRWMLTGVVIGLAAFFGRNSGVFCLVAAALALILLRLRRVELPMARSLGALALGILVGYSPMLFMIVFIQGFLKQFFQSVLLTPHWAWSLPIPFPWHVHVRGLHGFDLLQARAVSWLCVFVPAAYAYLLWRTTRATREVDSAEWLATAASCVGLGFLIHAFYTADFFHIAQGVVPFVVASGAFAAHLWNSHSHRASLSVIGVLTFLVVACWLPIEPLAQYRSMKAHNLSAVSRITVEGKSFEVPSEQADLMRTIDVAFEHCGARDGQFFTTPYYPGLYAFLNTRAPTWDTFFLWNRSDSLQQQEIESIQRNQTSLFLLNRESAMNGRQSLALTNTNPALVRYIVSNYTRSAMTLPQGFELYYSPQQCGAL